MREAPGQPNRIRAVRTADAKYAFYFDPKGREPSEYELYNLDSDPNEVENLLGVRSGESRDPRARELQRELTERLREQMDECDTAPR